MPHPSPKSVCTSVVRAPNSGMLGTPELEKAMQEAGVQRRKEKKLVHFIGYVP